jgi:DHA1 family inner membrane transport protein
MAPLAMSWYTTAMYIGIAVAPPLGAAALAVSGGHWVPVVGAIVVALGLVAFQLGYARRREAASLAAA